MALLLPPGLTPNEEGFLAEMELVTVIPRQKLERLELLGVSSFLAVSQQRKNKPAMLGRALERSVIAKDTITDGTTLNRARRNHSIRPSQRPYRFGSLYSSNARKDATSAHPHGSVSTP